MLKSYKGVIKGMENVVKDALLVLTSKNEKVLKKNKEQKIYKPYECKSYNVQLSARTRQVRKHI